MASKGNPKSYARAVFEIALERNELDKWRSDLKLVSSLAEDAVLQTLLESPKLSFEDKMKMVNEHLPEIGSLTRNLIYLLIMRGKVNLIGRISEQYQQLVDDYHGVEHAEVITAIPLDDTEMKKLENTLTGLLGKKLVLETRVDPAIIGGLVVRVNGKLIEGSIRDKLLSLKKDMGGLNR